MYPFDKYYINTNIIASAWITGLTNMNQVMRRIGTSALLLPTEAACSTLFILNKRVCAELHTLSMPNLAAPCPALPTALLQTAYKTAVPMLLMMSKSMPVSTPMSSHVMYVHTSASTYVHI